MGVGNGGTAAGSMSKSTRQLPKLSAAPTPVTVLPPPASHHSVQQQQQHNHRMAKSQSAPAFVTTTGAISNANTGSNMSTTSTRRTKISVSEALANSLLPVRHPGKLSSVGMQFTGVVQRFALSAAGLQYQPQPGVRGRNNGKDGDYSTDDDDDDDDDGGDVNIKRRSKVAPTAVVVLPTNSLKPFNNLKKFRQVLVYVHS